MMESSAQEYALLAEVSEKNLWDLPFCLYHDCFFFMQENEDIKNWLVAAEYHVKAALEFEKLANKTPYWIVGTIRVRLPGHQILNG